MTLEVNITRTLGRKTDGFRIETRFTSESGISTLFGRSGSGKTSVINMIAGLLKPETGYIRVNDRTLFDHDNGINLPPYKRGIGYVFQQDRLFPHLSVRSNLLFGQRLTPVTQRYANYDQVVELLDIAPLLKRRTMHLSGGEKQRTAIARALLSSPQLVLMDEPLASLDAARKAEILPYIERLRDEMNIPVVYVSHSLDEVTRLADTLVVMSDGRVTANGPVQDIMGRIDLSPMTGRYEAGSVIETQIKSHDDTYQLSLLEFDGGQITIPRSKLPLGTILRLHVRARDVAIALQPPEEISILNTIASRVLEISQEEGPFAEVRLQAGSQTLLARLTNKSVHRLQLEPGKPVYALIKSIAIDKRNISAGVPKRTMK